MVYSNSCQDINKNIFRRTQNKDPNKKFRVFEEYWKLFVEYLKDLKVSEEYPLKIFLRNNKILG